MDEDDEFGDLYTDVLQPFKSSDVAQPPPPPPPPPSHSPIDLNLHRDSFPRNGAAPISRVSDSKLTSPAIDKDMKFDIEDADTDALPAIPGLSMPASEAEPLPALPTDRSPSGIGKASDRAMRGQGDGEGDDWDSDSEDDLQIVLNDSSRNGLIGAERRENPPPPPPAPSHSPIDLNLRSLHRDSFSRNGAAPISRVSDSKLTSPAIDKDMKFDIEDADTDALPAIPGLSMPASEAEPLPALPTDRSPSGIGKASDRAMRGQGDGEGDDWDSDSEDDLQIVLNDSSRNGLIGAERRENPDNDDEDDEEPLVIVTDTDPNQAMEEQLWAEDSLQAREGDGKDGGEVGKASGAGGATAAPKTGYIGYGYHPFHSQFKYVRPGAGPMPGVTTTSAAGISSAGQVRPPVNAGLMAGRGRGDWRPPGMKNASVPHKGFHLGSGTPWGGRGSGVGLDFTPPPHKTIFEVNIDGFEEKPWRYPGVDITDFFNFGLTEESWKDYCKQLEQHRVATTMQSRIRVYESGRTDQGYDPDLPPELAAATGVQGVLVDSSNLVKPDATQGDSTKGPAHVRPPLPPGRPIPVEAGSGERLPSIDTRGPRIRDTDAIIEIVCQDSHEDEPSAGNGVDQVGNSLPEENLLGDVNSGRPDIESSIRAPTQDEPGQGLHDKQEDEISESTDGRCKEDEISESVDGRCSLRSSSPIGDREARSSSPDQKDTAAEASKGSEMEEGRKMSSGLSKSVVQEDDGGESKTERHRESHREYQQSAEEEVIQHKLYARPAMGRKHLDENTQHPSRKNQDRGHEIERTRVASRGGRENSHPHMEIESIYPYNSHARGEDFDKRKERDVAGNVWRSRQDGTYSRRSGDESSRKRDSGDDQGSRHRGKTRDSETNSRDNHRKHLDDNCLRNNPELVDDYVSKRRKDEEYLRRSCSDKNENLHDHQRESASRPKRERDDRSEHQRRDVQRIREDSADRHSFRHRDEFYSLRDGNERDNLKQTREGSSVRGRETQVAMRSLRRSEDRASRMKDEYRGSDKELLNKDTARHSKQQKRRENAYEQESSLRHRGHEDVSARADEIINNEKKLRQERTSGSEKVSSDQKHKESRRNNKEHRVGDAADNGPLRSKQEEQNGSFEESVPKGSNGSRNSRRETEHQSNSDRRQKEEASSDDEPSKRGRSKLERWTSRKERDSTSSLPLKIQEMDQTTNGGGYAEEDREAADGSTGKNRDGNGDAKETGQKPRGERHSDTVEKLKKRSERFKLPMPNEKNTASTAKKTKIETLPCAKIEGPVESEVKAERPARKRRWTSN
ncbi:PREDICTED: FIP1[V]-like protein [Tarenaya hassleriana]|uniref:FIP1[V]-like protein n=1 Tax=Tarenaya hassleriana TaxID=28532 RepID=UPI0008FD2CCF|nr:PREDICTED: FIP1[V]-like protein [Tarenaya hassleriana]